MAVDLIAVILLIVSIVYDWEAQFLVQCLLCMAGNLEKLEQFFTPPPPSALFDFDTPSSDLATARIQASWWNAKAAIYMPFIRRFCDNTHAFGDWHSEDLEKVKRGVFALIGSLRAFYGVSGELMIMPNVASTAYLQPF
ncbi:uncharacterized protein B0T15DRAFT_576175 [Chaetomium strumarium]|uniref:Uncharacterized protein n=1 Tax=Chaetomium strumarium TaxID=1170767 RepID=A0AAJ0GRZ9_9PEZI|nr:hypothetical protein B0T15DRAFT_576175 [Chaetomium strumarium]